MKKYYETVHTKKHGVVLTIERAPGIVETYCKAWSKANKRVSMPMFTGFYYNKELTPVQEPVMHWKDEGEYFTAKLTKDGKPAEPSKMYEFGELQTISAASKKEARKKSQAFGAVAKFDF